MKRETGDGRRQTQALLDSVITVATAAGEKILRIYDSDFAVTHKDDQSPLTQADLASHRHIVAALRQLTPELPCLSEEGAGIPYAQRRAWRRYWLVDPLDGTKEFVQKNGEFTVNIALIEDGRPVLGVVHAPVKALTYAAEQGTGAFKLDGGRHVELHTRAPPAEPTFVVTRSHRNPELESFLAHAPSHRTANCGSSLKFCLIAQGAADLYPRTGPTSEWDTAAGQCVVEQAGGAVLRLPELTPLAYNERESLLNPWFAVIGDRGHDWTALLALLS